jgi:hypothetical protein
MSTLLRTSSAADSALSFVVPIIALVDSVIPVALNDKWPLVGVEELLLVSPVLRYEIPLPVSPPLDPVEA